MISFLVVSCATPSQKYVNKIQRFHAKSQFQKQSAIQSDIEIHFGGKKYLTGKMTFSTDSGKGKIAYKDGREIIFHGNKMYYSADNKNKGAARFDAYTWAYFQLFPYKLSDEGVILSDYNQSHLSEQFETKKLTFKDGTGDAPKDWYVLYRNKDPHAIKYHNFIDVSGVPFASKWSFWSWTKKDEFKKQIGHAQLKNIKFISVNKETCKSLSENRIIDETQRKRFI